MLNYYILSILFMILQKKRVEKNKKAADAALG